MRIFECMKSRVNLTVEEKLLSSAKKYADRHHTSLSQLVEGYFKNLTHNPRKKNIIQLIEELPKPKISSVGDLKENYYQQQKKKYGF